jgi:TRAP-type C4-dicarboxylate transport system substrate-binding protein
MYPVSKIEYLQEEKMMNKNILRVLTFACAVLLIFSLASCSKKGDTAGLVEKQKITLRIGSGHAISNPWVTVLENFFVPEVSKRVAEKTNYEIE